MDFNMNITEGKNKYFQTDKGNILEVYRETELTNPRAAGVTGATRISGRFESEAFKNAELNMRYTRPDLSDPKQVPTTLDELRELTGVNAPKMQVNLQEIANRIDAYIDANAEQFSPGAKHFRPLGEMMEFCEKHGIQTDDILLCEVVEEGRDIALYLYDDVAFKAETGVSLADASAELKAEVLDDAVRAYHASHEGHVYSCNLYNSKGQHMAEHRGFFGDNIESNGMLSCIPDEVTCDMGQMPNISIAKFRALREAEPKLQSLNDLINAATGNTEKSAATPKAKEDISL